MDYILLHTVPFGLACWWWWLWSLGAMILGCLICRFLFGGGEDNSEEIAKLEADRDRYHTLATEWETKYSSLRYQLEEAQKSEADLRAALQRCKADNQTLQYKIDNAAAGTTVLGVADLGDDDNDGGSGGYAGLFTNDNLQIIEGIGPKIQSVLHEAGYRTWSDLAAADVSALRGVLENAGSRYKLADPTSWPHQAQLAANGDWPELIRYQKFTDGGRETTGDFATPSKFEKLAAKKMGFSSTNPNDLKVVEGIGPKIEGLFKADGINTWSELAATSTDRMQQILNAAGERYRLAKPDSWAEQARLAAEGKWEELGKLQASLRGGVK